VYGAFYVLCEAGNNGRSNERDAVNPVRKLRHDPEKNRTKAFGCFVFRFILNKIIGK